MEKINGQQFVDWQVTTCFYCAVHLVNAHLSLHNMQYRKHVDVKDAINPKNAQSISNNSSFPDDVYLAYTKLQSLSRRSRYLVNDNDNNLNSDKAALTFDVHLAKAIRHLNTMWEYMNKVHSVQIPKIILVCDGINQASKISFIK